LRLLAALLFLGRSWPGGSRRPRFIASAWSLADGPIAWLTESPYATAFVQAMHDLGYVEGQNLTLERRTAEGKVVERTAEIVEDLIHREVDVIVAAHRRAVR
jgi:hypothetical protein